MKTLDAKILALYLGAECLITKSGYTAVHEKYYHKGETTKIKGPLIDLMDHGHMEVKPILRRLESMTEEDVVKLVHLRSNIFLNVTLELGPGEKIDRRWIWFEFEYKSSRRRRRQMLSLNELNSEQFAFLLSKHFDLFNLIDSGLALDAATINPKPLLEGEK